MPHRATASAVLRGSKGSAAGGAWEVLTAQNLQPLREGGREGEREGGCVSKSVAMDAGEGDVGHAPLRVPL